MFFSSLCPLCGHKNVGGKYDLLIIVLCHNVKIEMVNAKVTMSQWDDDCNAVSSMRKKRVWTCREK